MSSVSFCHGFHVHGFWVKNAYVKPQKCRTLPVKNNMLYHCSHFCQAVAFCQWDMLGHVSTQKSRANIWMWWLWLWIQKNIRTLIKILFDTFPTKLTCLLKSFFFGSSHRCRFLFHRPLRGRGHLPRRLRGGLGHLRSVLAELYDLMSFPNQKWAENQRPKLGCYWVWQNFTKTVAVAVAVAVVVWWSCRKFDPLAVPPSDFEVAPIPCPVAASLWAWGNEWKWYLEKACP